MIEIKFINLKKFDLEKSFKLCEKEKVPFGESITISSFSAISAFLVANSCMGESINLLPSQLVRLSTLAGILVPIAGTSIYEGANKLIKVAKLKEAREMLRYLNTELGSYGIKSNLRRLTDLNRISVPVDLHSEPVSEEDCYDYFWFKDNEGNIQAITQEQDESKRFPCFKHYILEESDEELEYIRKKVK